MGYTHYWKSEQEFTPKQWTKLCQVTKAIFDATDIPVQYEYDDNRSPEISPQHIRFNGVENDRHETFVLNCGLIEFDFCKTACKPYDEIVVAILIAAADINKEFSWSSDGDGDPDAFTAGKTLYSNALNPSVKLRPLSTHAAAKAIRNEQLDYDISICRENSNVPWQFYIQFNHDKKRIKDWLSFVYDATPQGLHDAMEDHRDEKHCHIADLVNAYFDAHEKNA